MSNKLCLYSNYLKYIFLNYIIKIISKKENIKVYLDLKLLEFLYSFGYNNFKLK